MLKQIEGSLGIAEAVALCRPGVVCAYPISPQTHIVENVGKLVKEGKLQNCEFINCESEFSALSISIGASAGGVRTYTATASTPDKVELSYLLLQKLSNEADGPFMPFTTLIVFQDPKGPDYYGVHLYLTNAADSASPYIRYKISNTVSKYTMNYFDTDVEDGSLLFYPVYMLSHRILYTEKDTLDIYPLDTLELELNCHSPEYYDYLQQLNDAASGSNPIFATPAGPVKGNISGGAYGAFGVYTVSRQKQAVPYYPETWTDEQMTKRFGHDWRTLFDEQTE